MLWVCGSLYDESSAETNDFNKQVKSWMLYLKINSTDNAIYMHVIKASNSGRSNGWNPLFCWCHYGHDGSNEMLNGYNHLTLK